MTTTCQKRTRSGHALDRIRVTNVWRLDIGCVSNSISLEYLSSSTVISCLPSSLPYIRGLLELLSRPSVGFGKWKSLPNQRKFGRYVFDLHRRLLCRVGVHWFSHRGAASSCSGSYDQNIEYIDRLLGSCPQVSWVMAVATFRPECVEQCSQQIWFHPWGYHHPVWVRKSANCYFSGRNKVTGVCNLAVPASSAREFYQSQDFQLLWRTVYTFSSSHQNFWYKYYSGLTVYFCAQILTLSYCLSTFSFDLLSSTPLNLLWRMCLTLQHPV